MDGDIGFEIEPDSGLFLVHCRGMWSPRQADAHFAAMARAIEAARAARRPVRVLVDLRGSRVQSQTTSQAMAEGNTRIHRRADRIAFVYDSALQALQVKRDVTTPRIAFFESMEEARHWIDVGEAQSATE